MPHSYATQRFLETILLVFFALSTPRRAPSPAAAAVVFLFLRVILDIPLSIFLTMFGFPADYLHTDELHKVVKVAEKKKATVRRAPSEFISVVPPRVFFHVFRSQHVSAYGSLCFPSGNTIGFVHSRLVVGTVPLSQRP